MHCITTYTFVGRNNYNHRIIETEAEACSIRTKIFKKGGTQFLKKVMNIIEKLCSTNYAVLIVQY